MKRIGTYLLTGLLFLCAWSLAPSQQAVRRTEDAVYGRKFGTALTMDVFQPVNSNGCGILFLVNGGWLSSKDTPLMVTVQPDYYRPFLDRGYTVFAVVTCSQPKFTIPEEMDDVQRAVRFVRHNAAKFGVQPDRLGITGSSSSGQLSLMIATQGSPGNPASPEPIERESSAVQAVACFFPPTDFLNWGGPGTNAVGLGTMASMQAAFGPRAATTAGRQELGREISPIYFLSSNLPPTLIIHGDADPGVPIQQSESFVVRAKAAGARHVQLLVRPGKGHGWGEFWKSEEDITAFADWFDRYLRSSSR
jgi:acetyl esterase/lipase